MLLVTGGLVLLAWFAYLWLKPIPAPYEYQQIATGDATQFSDLELDAWPDLAISQYNVQVAGIDKPLGQATLAQRGNKPPVLINWKNYTNELLISIDRKSSELSALATAIGKHAAKDALVLAWWDTSRQINLLSERDTLFTSHLNTPLITLGTWQNQQAAIQRYENEFWNTSASQQEQDQFQRFSEALLAAPEEGVAQLRALIGSSREAYLVVHVTDLYKIGLMHPDKIGVAYKNFPLTGNMHGMINHMKVHLKENNYATYTLQSLSETEIRAYFLLDSQSTNTLLAKMLPFTDQTAPTELEVAPLIYQHGGYWVYRIPGSIKTVDDGSNAP
tara:strand:+ start:1848 stop:2843 length:996 start_codon:yes stop_codon:yes gene_type:complete